MDNELATVAQEVKDLVAKIEVVKKEVGKKIVGQSEVLEQLLIAFLAGGHALLEGVPGLAKTLMIRSLSETMDLGFKRIQFTPDLMPSDIIGTEVLEDDLSTGKKTFRFTKGPLFSNMILADEINRTPPKTQAALLEAMQEFEVTYANKTYKLDQPFFILATQNPIEQSGTFVLPEAQQDRFLLYIKVGYPDASEEEKILKSTTGITSKEIQKSIGADDILKLQKMVREVYISDDLVKAVSTMVRNTRPETTDNEYIKKWVSWGAGPRAGQAMILTAKATALINNRLSVIPGDLKKVAYPVLRHRILMNFNAESEGITSDKIVDELIKIVV
ncbi:MoxR family ATPase [Aquimarina sp. ERC-38]|uniref:AAA family ATPase n=1 Tax=Aquimarina sp. ERC-38 TaxID=2949996 RepID=UPI002245F678|nr:MoxR family ATPase [Aquimarina sp. ERC-38]UZO80718.1 MoxR family ATPase [Aquimarina sp. ERC-38]